MPRRPVLLCFTQHGKSYASLLLNTLKEIPMKISAFDFATTVGVCDGRIGEKPRHFTWFLEDAGEGRPLRLALFRQFCDAYFAEYRPDVVCYEKPLPIAIAVRIGAAEDVVLMLRGGLGVLESCAAIAGVKRIESIGVQDARKHFTGQRTFKKGEAKAAVMRACSAMGYKVANADEADAVAIWSLACARENPASADLTRAHLEAKNVTIGRRSERNIGHGPLFSRKMK